MHGYRYLILCIKVYCSCDLQYDRSGSCSQILRIFFQPSRIRFDCTWVRDQYHQFLNGRFEFSGYSLLRRQQYRMGYVFFLNFKHKINILGYKEFFYNVLLKNSFQKHS